MQRGGPGARPAESIRGTTTVTSCRTFATSRRSQHEVGPWGDLANVFSAERIKQHARDKHNKRDPHSGATLAGGARTVRFPVSMEPTHRRTVGDDTEGMPRFVWVSLHGGRGCVGCRAYV